MSSMQRMLNTSLSLFKRMQLKEFRYMRLQSKMNRNSQLDLTRAWA
jgi:hypothetical protein